MLKKLLAVSLVCLMVCSTLSVVSFADTSAQTGVVEQWVETFDNYTNDQLATTDPATLYKDQNQECHNTAHYHLNDDWTVRDTAGTHLFSARYYKINDAGHGKANSDKALVWDYSGWAELTCFQNNFGGSPVVLENNKAAGVSFDWYSQSTQNHSNHINLYPTLQAYVTFTNGTETHENVLITLAKVSCYTVSAGSGASVNVQSQETWNKLEARITNNKIYVRGNTDSKVMAYDVSGYNPSTGAWVSATNNSGFEISSVNAVRIYNARGNYGQSGKSKHGFDNLKAYVYSGDASQIAPAPYENYMDFSAIMQVRSTDANGEGDGKQFYLADGNGNSGALYALSENTPSGNPITVSIMENDTATKSSSTRYSDGFFKVSNTVGTYIDGSPLCYIKQDTATTARAAIGDKVQHSYDFKFAGNENASSTSRWLELSGRFVSGVGDVVNISGNGVLYDPDNKSLLLAKLKPDTWYTLSSEYELTENGTVVKAYLNGKHLVTKTLTKEINPADTSSAYAIRVTYRNVANADNTGYLENSACFDNFSYRVCKGGAQVYNFDKSLAAASNKAIANANIDFVNNTIYPVSNEWTVADFNALGLANCTVLNSDNSVADAADALVGKKIAISGEYGKDAVYTVSAEGGKNVTKNSFVTISENLGNTFAASANAGKLLIAKAVKDGENLEVYIAEYKDGELVGLTLGNGVANYKPKASGNKIKVLIWNDGQLVPAFTGAVYELNVQ